jgi:hypothetical protein
MTAKITATGAKGFLLWLKQQQPGIYQKVAPELPSIVPEIFAETEKKLGALRDIYKTGLSRPSPQRLGQYSDYYLPAITVYSSDADITPISYTSSAPVTVNYDSVLSQMPSYASSSAPVTVDYSSQLTDTSGIGVATPDAPSVSTNGSSASSGLDVANAATSAGISTASAAQIASAVGAVAGTVLTAGEVGLLGKAVQSQLDNAVAGTAPKAISTGNLGITTVPAIHTSWTTWLLLAAAGIGAYFVVSS